MDAIMNDDLEKAEALLEKGDLVGVDFYYCLSSAIEANDLTKLRLLLDHGMQHNPSVKLTSFIGSAICFGGRPMLAAMLPHCTFSRPSDLYVSDHYFTTSDSRFRECIELLLEWNFTVDPRSHSKRDLVYAVVENGFLPIVEDFLNRGIDVNMVNSKTELNLLTIACLNKHHQVVERLLQHGAYANSAISSKHEMLHKHDRVRLNLRTFIDLFPPNFRGKDNISVTPLHIAIFNSDWMTTRALLRYGARFANNELFNLTCIAAKDGCTEIVSRFLNLGVDVRDLLHFCVNFNHDKKDYGYDTAKLLLKRGGEIHIKTPKNTIFINAIKNKHYKTARLFLDWNADVQYTCRDGGSLLHKAIENDFDEEFIKTLLDLKLPVDCKNNNGCTPLHLACKLKSKNKLPTIKTLLHYNADVECNDSNRRRPLHYACTDQDVDLVAVILGKGADPNAKDDKGLTPLHLVRTCRENKASQIIKLLLDHHANIEYIDDISFTPLIRACMNGQHDVAKCLLDNNANPNAVDYQRRTPLHHICDYGGDKTLEIIQLLLKCGANIEAMDADGQTPLFVACKTADEGIMKCLLDNHANSGHMDLKNLTPLNIVLKNYKMNFKTVYMLVNNNVNNVYVRTVDDTGRSIAHYVAETNDDRLITLFAAMGVNFNSVDNEGNTPLHVAVKKPCLEMTRYLIKYGVDIDISNKNGKTPLQEVLEMINPTDTPINSIYRFQWKELIVKELTEQVARLKVAGLKVSEQNLDIVYDSKYGNLSPRNDLDGKGIKFDVMQLEVECEKEIQMMKKESTGVDDLTFYDLLKRRIDFLSKVTEINKMIRILALEVYDKQYPLYINIIRKRFQEATILRKRNKMMDSARKFFRLNISERLPEECIDMILNFLDEKELNTMLAEDVKTLEQNQETWLGNARKFIMNFFFK